MSLTTVGLPAIHTILLNNMEETIYGLPLDLPSPRFPALMNAAIAVV